MEEKRLPKQEETKSKPDVKNNDPYFDEPNLSYIKKSMKELREGKGTVHELISPEEP